MQSKTEHLQVDVPAEGVVFAPPADDMSEESYPILCLSGQWRPVSASLSDTGQLSQRPCIVIAFLNDVDSAAEEYVSVVFLSPSPIGT